MKRESGVMKNVEPAQPVARPIAGELTLADLKAVVGGTVGPIVNGRFNPTSQKSRFSRDV